MSAHASERTNAQDAAAPLDQTNCFLCEREPGTVEAICDDQPVRVCRHCFVIETGEDPGEFEVRS